MIKEQRTLRDGMFKLKEGLEDIAAAVSMSEKETQMIYDRVTDYLLGRLVERNRTKKQVENF